MIGNVRLLQVICENVVESSSVRAVHINPPEYSQGEYQDKLCSDFVVANLNVNILPSCFKITYAAKP